MDMMEHVTDNSTPMVDAPTIEVSAAGLARVLGNVVMFASKDEIWPTLGCVHITGTSDNLAPGWLRVEATDSYKLGRDCVFVGQEIPSTVDCLIVAKDLGVVVKSFAKLPPRVMVRVTFGRDQVTFETAETVLRIPVFCGGKFPSFVSVMPKDDDLGATDGHQVVVTPDHFAVLAKLETVANVGKARKDRVSPAVRMRCSKKGLGPILVDVVGAHETFVGLIMPVRVYGS